MESYKDTFQTGFWILIKYRIRNGRQREELHFCCYIVSECCYTHPVPTSWNYIGKKYEESFSITLGYFTEKN